MPLSKIVPDLKTNPGVREIRGTEWEDDGYGRVIYAATSGRPGRARLDPFTGATWSRRDN